MSTTAFAYCHTLIFEKSSYSHFPIINQQQHTLPYLSLIYSFTQIGLIHDDVLFSHLKLFKRVSRAIHYIECINIIFISKSGRSYD